MEIQPINIATPRRRRHTHFRRLFIGYFLGVLVTTFLITGVLDLVAVFLVTLNEQNVSLLKQNFSLQIVIIVLFVALPCIVLIATLLFFAWRMGRKVSLPVDELMLAVEKIRRQDLNFSITYRENNELGDLCSAFNELRRELQESLEREWRKQEEMRTMIAALSHELRTPVTIIQGHVEGLARTEAGEKRNQRLERYLPVLEANSQRMTRLLNDVLLVASLEQARFLIQPQFLQLEEEMERKVGVYKLQAAAQEVEFSYTSHNAAAEADPVSLDLHRIEQVLDNLFENALRYTPIHGEINLTCIRHSHSLSFILRDTGCGIAPEDLPHIFEKFYQGRSPSSSKARKTAGLGLYICRLLVEEHKGTITIQNHPAGGCEVTVCVPTTLQPSSERLSQLQPPQIPETRG